MRILVAILMWSALAAPARAQTDKQVTVFVVRHADKAQDGTDDPALTEAGRARALALRHALGAVEISAVLSTPYKRTRQTAGPVAKAAGLEITPYRTIERARILEKYAGQAILIVGHSNTVPRIVAELGGPETYTIDDKTYDDLFVVGLSADFSHAVRLKYGVAPADNK